MDTEGARKSFAVGGGHAAPSTSAAPRIQAASSHPSAAEAAGLQLHFQVGVGTHLRGQVPDSDLLAPTSYLSILKYT